MKTSNFKTLYLFTILFIISLATEAQQTEIEYSSVAGEPHLQLTQTPGSSLFSRLTFKNQNPGFWTFAARTGTSATDDNFNLYYDNGTTGYNLLNIVGDSENINFTARNINLLGRNNSAAITLDTDNTNADSKITLRSGMDAWSITADGSDNRMTMSAGATRFMDVDTDGKVGIGTIPFAEAELSVNVGGLNKPNIALSSAGTSSAGWESKIQMQNGGFDGFISLEGNSYYNQFSDADFVVRYSEDGTTKKEILSAVYAYFDENGENSQRDDERVGIRTAVPLTDLHLIHKNGVSGHGFRIEHEGANNHWWKMYVSDGNGTLSLRNDASPTSNVGTFATNVTYTASDLRLKKEIEENPYGLSELMKMDAKTYHYKTDKSNSKKSIGFIAQDINEITPELVLYDSESDQYSLNYGAINVIAVQAIQEQQEIISQQANDIETLKSQMASLKANVDALIDQK